MNRPWNPSFRYLIGIITFLALVWFLYYARVALEPLVIAAFIAYLINPAVILLTRHTKLSRRSAVNLVYFTSLALLIGLPIALTPIFFNQMKDVAQDLLVGFEQLQLTLLKPIDVAGVSLNLQQLGIELTKLKPTLSSPIPEEAFLLIESTSRGAIWFIVIVVCVYLFLSEWQAIREWLVGLAPEAHRQEMEELYQRVRAVWMAYLRGQILLMLVVGIVFTIAWAIIGIPGALVLGVIAGLFTLVPDIGPFLAVVLAMAVALLEGSRWIPLSNFWVMMIVLAVYMVLISVKNFWLRPYILGRSLNMNEGVVLVAILIATILNGIIGALLVVPLLASAIIIMDYLLRRIVGQPPFPAGQNLFQPNATVNSQKLVHNNRYRLKKFNRN
jgi:predicted PurR-regulated permease PerM